MLDLRPALPASSSSLFTNQISEIPRFIFEVRILQCDEPFPNIEGLTFPDVPGRAVTSKKMSVFWVRPRGWWVVGAQYATNQILKTFEAFPTQSTVIIDRTHQYSVFRMPSELTQRFLGQASTAVYGGTALEAGNYIRTRVVGLQVLIHFLELSEWADVYVDRSAARYLAQWIADAMPGQENETSVMTLATEALEVRKVSQTIAAEPILSGNR